MSTKARGADNALENNRRRKTIAARHQLKHILQTADSIRRDDDRANRIAERYCLACHYSGPPIAGAAMTEASCLSCGKTELYSSTLTDTLCRDCSVKHDLCKHCGGDFGIKPG